MTIYNWFKIFNSAEFLALGLTSKTYTFYLDNIGQKDILVTSGEDLGMVYDGVFLALNMNDQNPFEFDSHAIYIDANDDVYLGLPEDEG